ncbi:MAG: DUF4159 domain-containing protein, partial [Acetobacteraceae bacterium]|nr:DUF4159 domain-containing protein [Acetobacteraceae bacterium]
RESFPAIRLLLGLHAREETPARTPWWLLLLRLCAAALVIFALAGPILRPGSGLPGNGPVLVVMDNGWASAPDWPRRVQAVSLVLDRAARTGREAALLATAADINGAAPHVTPVMSVSELRSRIGALRPQPWPTDRGAAVKALGAWSHPGTSVVYAADGLTDGPDFSTFARALSKAGQVAEICCDLQPARLMLPPESKGDTLITRVAQIPQPAPTSLDVLAQTGDGRTLAEAHIIIPEGASVGTGSFTLPPELRNRLTRLQLADSPSAGAGMLLDESWRRRPVGLATANPDAANTPFLGKMYYTQRALRPYTDVTETSLSKLLSQDMSVIVLADDPLPEGPEHDGVRKWVENGGLLLRFAGPLTAAQSANDALMPVKLLSGDRQLGGALTWGKPATLAPFPPNSPFSGLTIPSDVTVSRQVLAEPSATLSAHTWATLADGTPLVTAAPFGRGQVVLFHVTANDDWSNLPLSGLFVDMLRRVVSLSAGVKSASGNATLAPAQTLDGFGELTSPPPAASPLPADKFATTPASPRHPPGFYGPENGRRALNLADVMPLPTAAPIVAGARRQSYAAVAPEKALGPTLLTAALVLFILDLLISLVMRGLLRPVTVGRVAAFTLLVGLSIPYARADSLPVQPNPALGTRLGYIESGDPELSQVDKQGLEGLSEYVNARTAATLYEPDAVILGKTDLSFYPMLYWSVPPEAEPLSAQAAQALNDFMSRGGILVIDTNDSAPGADLTPGNDGNLRRATKGLQIPPLTPLSIDHVLARTFYLCRDYPGRYDGGSVWVQQGEDRNNDDVSPVIIGGNDWVAAWAVNSDGTYPYAVIPGGDRQRTWAYRFGVNLVMYALTGNYKGDQVHVQAILQRLGQ